MNCPICKRTLPPKILFTCAACWPLVPANDRRMLGSMHRRGQDTDSKVASVVRKVIEKLKS